MITSLKKLWWLLSRREKRNAFLLSLLLLVNGVLEMVGVGIVPVYVGIVAYPDKLIEHDLVQAVFASPGEILTQTTLLYWGSAAVLVFFTVKLLYTVFLSYYQARFVHNRVLKIGDRLFTAYMLAPYTFHLGRNSAQLLRNVNTECTQLGASVLAPVIQLATHFFVVLAVAGLLIVASPGFAVASLVLFIAVAAAVSGTLHGKFKELGLKAQAARGEVVRSVNEGLGGVKEIRILQREGAFTGRFREALGDTLYVQRFMQVIGHAIPVVMEWVSVAGLLVVVLLLFGMGNASETVVSTVVLFTVALLRLKGAIGSIIGRYTGLRQNLVSVDVVYDDLCTLEREATEEGGVRKKLLEEGGSLPVIDFRHQIVLEDISFRYPNAHEDALRDVSLTIDKGEAIGFVGSTGAGKSTLIDVVLGVLTPTTGKLLVDGVHIRTDMDAWQRNVGYIPQSIYLVDGTIKQNIALGLPAARIDDVAVERSMRAAHLEHFIATLPNGVNTIVGERGIRLSGGQRQRIAIARALYHNPDVLIMDEATSALDNVTERAVIRAVEELKGERTILMIAHRLSTVRNCDRIVLLGHGIVEAIGTYEELIEASEDFRRMAQV
ncbi:MAG: ABC transporter ATP-binding protein [Gammaproteobacteria bacterium]|nr:ABC transporter ATP-binding protein [Gammaproteobacteria bacterium]